MGTWGSSGTSGQSAAAESKSQTQAGRRCRGAPRSSAALPAFAATSCSRQALKQGMPPGAGSCSPFVLIPVSWASLLAGSSDATIAHGMPVLVAVIPKQREETDGKVTSGDAPTLPAERLAPPCATHSTWGCLLAQGAPGKAMSHIHLPQVTAQCSNTKPSPLWCQVRARAGSGEL